LNLRPSGYEGDFTQPADGRRPSCFQSSRVVSSSAKSTEVHAGIRKSPPVWTRLVKVSASRFEPATFAFAILKARIPEPPRRSTPSPRLQFHSRRSRGPIHGSSIPHRRNKNLWVQRGVQDVLFLLQLRPSSSECAPPRSTRCAPVDNCHTFAS